MFVDYYKVLEISFPSSQEEIKKSYRQLSLKWHPDKNPSIDTTHQMQAINAAYFLLKDPIKKQRYDVEYKTFYNSNQNTSSADSEEVDFNKDSTKDNCGNFYYQQNTYNYHNQKVKDDIYEANRYAKNIVDEFMKQFTQSSHDAVKGAWNGMYPYIIVAFILPILFTLIRSCQ